MGVDDILFEDVANQSKGIYILSIEKHSLQNQPVLCKGFSCQTKTWSGGGRAKVCFQYKICKLIYIKKKFLESVWHVPFKSSIFVSSDH